TMQFAMYLLFGITLATSSHTNAIPNEEPESANAFRKASENAEIHAIGISDPAVYHFDEKEVTEWPQLIDLIRRKEGPSGRIWDLLPDKARDLVKDDKIVGQLAAPRPTSEAARLKGTVSGGLKKMLSLPDFYTKEA